MSPTPLPINLPDVVAEVTQVFMRYNEALVSNHVEVLDELFWPSEHTVRYGVTENLYGIEEIRAFRSGRPAVNLARTLRRTVITTFGPDAGTAMTEFVRDNADVIGRQSQTWMRLPGLGWRVVAAHVSLLRLAPIS